MSNNMELYVIILLLSSSDHCMLSHYKVTFCVEATPSSTQSRSRFADKQFRTYCTFSSTTLSTVCIKVPLQYITFKLQTKHVIVKYMIHVWFFVFLLSALSMFIYSHRVTTLKLITNMGTPLANHLIIHYLALIHQTVQVIMSLFSLNTDHTESNILRRKWRY